MGTTGFYWGGELPVHREKTVSFFHPAGSVPTTLRVSKTGNTSVAAVNSAAAVDATNMPNLYNITFSTGELDTPGDFSFRASDGTDDIYIFYEVVSEPLNFAGSVHTGYQNTVTTFRVVEDIIPTQDDAFRNAYLVWTNTQSGVLENSGPFLVSESMYDGVTGLFVTELMPIAPTGGDRFVVVRK